MAKWLIALGAALVIADARRELFPKLSGGFDRLPGDIRIEGDLGRLFVPITAMLIVSLAPGILSSLWRR